MATTAVDQVKSVHPPKAGSLTSRSLDMLGARTLIEEVSRRRRAVVRYLVEDRPFGRVLLKI